MRRQDRSTRLLKDAARWSALARRVQATTGLLDQPGGGAEWPKPAYKLDWPAGLDENAPDITRPDLPLNLGTILRDLDQIRTDLAKVDAELAISSFMWMVRDGLVLDPVRHRYTLDQLNVGNFPFTYRDLERMAAFQNRVLAAYARAHGLPFLDVAAHDAVRPQPVLRRRAQDLSRRAHAGLGDLPASRAADRAAAGKRRLAQTGADDAGEPSRLRRAAAACSARLPQAG